MAEILIVEDEASINELIKRTLNAAGHRCLQAYKGMEAVSMGKKHTFDLVLLDVNLPDISGWKVKESLGSIPVIYVTARDELGDKIRGLNGGAQDYIVKPFAMEELVARVHVVLGRFQKEEKLFRLHGTEVFLDSCRVKVDGEAVALTYQEFELLRTLIIHKNIALSRDQLLDMAWGMDFLGDARTVDVHIQRIRKKLHLENDIKTVYKRGYRLEC